MYIYDAVGTKLRKTVSGITTDYAGNYIYENGVLQFFNHAEGYAEPVSTGSTAFKYVYQYKDHTSARLSAGLGNIRLSYKDVSTTSTPVLQILEENNYYPFVLKHKGYNNTQNGRDHKYGFGNKEEQNELGLGWIDITARNYDAALGRWMNVDPLAEAMRRHSPYNYAFDNPVYFIDPDGMFPEIEGAKKWRTFTTYNGNVQQNGGNNFGSITHVIKETTTLEHDGDGKFTIQNVEVSAVSTIIDNSDGSTTVLTEKSTTTRTYTVKHSGSLDESNKPILEETSTISKTSTSSEFTYKVTGDDVQILKDKTTINPNKSDFTNRPVDFNEQHAYVQYYGLQIRNNLLINGADYVPWQYTFNDLETLSVGGSSVFTGSPFAALGSFFGSIYGSYYRVNNKFKRKETLVERLSRKRFDKNGNLKSESSKLKVFNGN